MRDAFRYDSKVLVEEAIEGPEELEISILGNDHPIASKIGAIKVPANDAFTLTTTNLLMPAKLSLTYQWISQKNWLNRLPKWA